jgi:hypothetical protein
MGPGAGAGPWTGPALTTRTRAAGGTNWELTELEIRDETIRLDNAAGQAPHTRPSTWQPWQWRPQAEGQPRQEVDLVAPGPHDLHFHVILAGAEIRHCAIHCMVRRGMLWGPLMVKSN